MTERITDISKTFRELGDMDSKELYDTASEALSDLHDARARVRELEEPSRALSQACMDYVRLEGRYNALRKAVQVAREAATHKLNKGVVVIPFDVWEPILNLLAEACPACGGNTPTNTDDGGHPICDKCQEALTEGGGDE